MKKAFAFVILLIILVVASGCTQQTAPAATTPAPTTAPATEVPTVQATLPPTAVPTTLAPTPVETKVVIVEVISTAAATPKPAVTADRTPQITSTKFYFRNNTITPSELTVLPGTGITWINEDSTVHSVKAIGDHAGMFNSGDIVPTATWGYSFGENEGKFEFKDTYSNATGIVYIKKGASLVGYTLTPTSTPAKI